MQQTIRDTVVNQTTKGASWGIIILLLCLCFPIGIYLLIAKMHKEPNNYLSNSKGTMTVGWVFVGFGIFYAIAGVSGGLETSSGESTVSSIIAMIIICCGGGYALIRYGRKYKKIGEKALRYKAIILNSPDGSLDNIAAAYPCPYEDACADLQDLIDKGLFVNSYLDLNQRSFISPNLNGGMPSSERTGHRSNDNSSVIVKCPNCGAANTVTDQQKECEYCGSPLK